MGVRIPYRAVLSSKTESLTSRRDNTEKNRGRGMRTFWVSALQSSIFNHLLEARMRAGTTDRILEGDVAFRHESRKSFLADAGMMAREDLAAETAAFELSPGGPILGPGMPQATGAVLDSERAAFADAYLYDLFSQEAREYAFILHEMAPLCTIFAVTPGCLLLQCL